jgi:hypothetical protein
MIICSHNLPLHSVHTILQYKPNSKYLLETRASKPTDFRNLSYSAVHPYCFSHFIHISTCFSQSSDIALIEEILCARKALAVNFDNSDDHTFVVNILSSDNLHTHQQALVSLLTFFSRIATY